MEDSEQAQGLGPLEQNAADGQDGQGARIYGKEGCPHTLRARKALPKAQFLDVLSDPLLLQEMLRLTGGVRRVPVIQRGDAVEIGFRRGA